MLRHSLRQHFYFYTFLKQLSVLEKSQVQRNKFVVSFFDILYNSSISKCVLKLFAIEVCSKILDRLGFNSSTE